MNFNKYDPRPAPGVMNKLMDCQCHSTCREAINGVRYAARPRGPLIYRESLTMYTPRQFAVYSSDTDWVSLSFPQAALSVSFSGPVVFLLKSFLNLHSFTLYYSLSWVLLSFGPHSRNIEGSLLVSDISPPPESADTNS